MSSVNDASQQALQLQTFLPYRLLKLAKQLSDSYAEVYQQQFGLSIPEWRVLAHLSEAPDLNAKDIGTMALMDKSKVSRAVKLLEQKQLLEKRKGQEDQRVYDLKLTEKGKRLYTDIVPLALHWEAELIAALGSQQGDAFFKSIEVLERQLQTMRGD